MDARFPLNPLPCHTQRLWGRKGIPYELAGKIAGETEEEMKKDAEKFVGFIKSGNRYPNFNADPVNKESREDVALKEMLNDLKGE